LTDLWTGDLNGKSEHLITTGLLGSIRWWFEVLVRGLGGGACDPTADAKCEGRNHCVVCELFGCTGWARKFRFEVLDKDCNIRETNNNDGTNISPQIKKDEKFSLRFTALRPICNEEWTLLDATLRLIAEYGAIGGKTVFKPTDESDRSSKLHHKDFGLVQIVSSPPIDKKDRGYLETYVSKWPKFDDGDFAWASLQYFWYVKGKYLGRKDNNKSTFNQVLGRQEAKNQAQQLAARNDEISKCLAGSQQESKKVFSFKNHARTFGFVKPDLIDFNTIKDRLRKAWPDLKDYEFREGSAILNYLLLKEDLKEDRP